eukprot:3726988-Pleurochrysis_carterae.AAC.1
MTLGAERLQHCLSGVGSWVATSATTRWEKPSFAFWPITIFKPNIGLTLSQFPRGGITNSRSLHCKLREACSASSFGNVRTATLVRVASSLAGVIRPTYTA